MSSHPYIFGANYGGGGGSSVSLSLSDSTPDFGDTITLTATATGFTGTITYYFAVLNNLGYYARTEQVGDNTFDYACSFDGTFGVEVVAIDGGGNSAVAFTVLTVSTLESKYAITAAYRSDVVVTDNKVQEWVDIVSATYNAAAPSATDRCFLSSNPLIPDSVGVYSEVSRRLLTPLDMNTSEVTIYGAFYYNDNLVQGSFNLLALVSGDSNITNCRWLVAVTDDSINPRNVAIRVRTSSGVFAIDEVITTGTVRFVIKYSAGELRAIINGTTQTIAVVGSLVGTGTIGYNLLNANTGTWGIPFPFPTYELGIKTAAISDAQQDQLYADILLRYP